MGKKLAGIQHLTSTLWVWGRYFQSLKKNILNE